MAAKRPLKRRARNPWVRRIKRTLWFLSFVTLLGVSAGLVVYIPIYQEAADDAANIDAKLTVKDENPTVIVSADKGRKVLYRIAAIRRTVVKLRDLPDYVRYAIVAAEDRRFYDHQGVDPVGLARVAFTALRDRHFSSGGSTISMQLAKLMINGDARTPLRKLKDIATAQQIESLKTKDEILDLYANFAYYGEHAYGIERAAEIYFGKRAKDLTIGEAAMLARCVRLPGRVNPIKSPEKMLDLRDYVLDVMREESWITQGQYDEAKREVPKLNPHPSYNTPLITKDAGYFVDHVLSQLKQDFPGVDFMTGGYTIETTLNYPLQQHATEAVDQVLAENKGHKVNDGAIVVMDGQGRVMAEVGGPDYAKRQYNVITQGGHQPGSAFKAFVYATALKDGVYDLNSRISNARLADLGIKQPDGSIWDPDNASPRENANSYTMLDAFALSVNRPAIHALLDVHPDRVVDAAHKIFGFKSELGATGSLALGAYAVSPLEMLEGYSVFMLGGDRVEPQVIARVIAPDGTVLREYAPQVHAGVLDSGVAQKMDELLKAPVEYGTATIARDVPNARGKTGTTNAAKDAWFCGYSDGLLGVGWVGNSEPKTGKQLAMSNRVFGGTVTVKIWRQVMLAAHNLNLATGLKRAPGTHVQVVASPDDPVPPAHRSWDDRPRRHSADDAPPVDLEPDPKSVDPPPVTDPDKDAGDGAGNDNGDPSTAPPKTSADPPPPTDPPATPPEEGARAAVLKRADRPRRDPAPKKAAAPEEESVVICVDTGLRAGMYCPETVTRRFPKGQAPRKRCTLHHA